MQVARPNTEFQLCKLPVWPQFSNSNRRKYTVTGGPQYCDHLRPAPEESVRWYAQWTSGMCMCMSPRARWKMVYRCYLYVLSVTVVLFLCLPLSSCVVRKVCTSYTNLHKSYCSLEKSNITNESMSCCHYEQGKRGHVSTGQYSTGQVCMAIKYHIIVIIHVLWLETQNDDHVCPKTSNGNN